MSHTSPAFVASSHEQSINCNCSDKNNIFIDFQDPNSARIGLKGQKSILHKNNLIQNHLSTTKTQIMLDCF